ncbi:MAG: ACP S-malonyltransferase [Bacillota bacterium]
MTERYALMFPGQGAQYVGMGEDLLRESARAREVFSRASSALGWDVADLCVNGPAERLNLTEYTQPALLTLSAAAWEELGRRVERRPEFAAGLSLGEYSALVAAGALDLEDACVLVNRRGRFMQEAVPPGVGAMAAIIGLEAEIVQTLCAQIEEEGEGVVRAANFNCPGQIVISGQAGPVSRACEALSKMGARRAVTLEVSAPFHCPLMEPAAERLAAALAEVTLRRAEFPVVANVWAREVVEPDEIRKALLQQMSSPVRWEESIRLMLDRGVKTFVEVGAGKVLNGFLRRIERRGRGMTCETSGEIEEVANQL